MCSLGEDPLVSVVVPSYRCVEWLGDALDSIFRQTYQRIEVLVVDQDQNEPADQVLSRYENCIRRLRLAPPSVSAARNMAIREATGSLIAQLDADDVWEDTAVEDLLGLLTSSGADVAFGDAVFFGNTPDAGMRLSDLFPAHPQITYIDVARRRTRVNISVLGKRSAFLDAGLYDPQLLYGEDLDLWMRMLLKGKRFEFTDKVVLRYRRRLGSLTSEPSVHKLNKALDLYDKHLALTEVPQSYRDVLNEEKKAILNMLHVEQGKLALLGRDYKAASGHFSRLSWGQRPLKVFLASLALSVSPALAGPAVRRALNLSSDSPGEQSE